MPMAKICTAVAAVALLLMFSVPGSADGGWHKGYGHWHGRYWHGLYRHRGRIYPPYPWGYPWTDLGWKYPMFGKWMGGYRHYYYQLPPYWGCCW